MGEWKKLSEVRARMDGEAGQTHSLEEGLLITELATRSEGHCLGLLLGGENMYRTEEDAGYGQIPIYTHPPTIV